MFKSTPHKDHSNDQSFTTASKRTQTLSLGERRQHQSSAEGDKRVNQNQGNKICYKNKKRILKLQVMPQRDSLEKTAIRWSSKSQVKSSLCLRMKQDKKYQLKIKATPTEQTINKFSRVILIDWLIEVSLQLKISKDALYQALHYLDKLTNYDQITKSDYQFYGLACLWLSHKTDSRNAISYGVAEQMVKGSRQEKWFKEAQVKIIKKLGYKLSSFTVWQQVNMLACGFEKYFKTQLAEVAEWSQYRNRIGWICEGLILQNKHSQEQQQFLALSIVFLVGCKLAQLGYLQQKKLLSFCLKLTNHQNLQLLTRGAQSIRYWMDYSCGCIPAFSPSLYHPQLKQYAKQR